MFINVAIFWEIARHLLHADLLLGWFSTLKMEVIRCFETSVHIRTTRRCDIPEDDVHNYRFENLKSYMLNVTETPLLGCDIRRQRL
jgi:hypothetical protein